jgi:WD40 repeat protein
VTRPSDAGDELLAELVACARRQAPLPLLVACGLGGGGDALVDAILDAAGLGGEEVLREELRTSEEPTGVLHRARDCTIIDTVARSGVGPCPSFAGEGQGDGWNVVLVRDYGASARPLASFSGPGAEESVFCTLLSQRCSVLRERAAKLAARIGCPTALISDMERGHGGWGDRSADELLEAFWTLDSVIEMRSEMVANGGGTLFDLGRALCLVAPAEMELSDEWALLAGALAGRVYAISDISITVQTFPGLFEITHRARATLVKPSSRLGAALLLGGVPPSASEHFAIYSALRDRSLAVLARRDESDRFVANELPRQASAANALPELTSDPLGVLCSDTFALMRELEAHPAYLRMPAAKAVALSAHRLLTGPDRASQLELSARRAGLGRFADSLAAQLPDRRWRAVWAQSELAHTHRVAFNHRTPLLAVAAVEDPEGLAFVGCADGEVWRISPYQHPRCLEGSKPIDGEIRAVAARITSGRPLVAVGTSTHAIGVLDGDSGGLMWMDSEAHQDPLSAATIHNGDQDVLLTAGVGGVILKHPLLDGAGLGQAMYTHGSEIRDLQVVRVAGTDMIAFCAVDGIVGVARLADGRPVAHWHMAEEVLNSVAAVMEHGSLRLVAGTSKGSLRELRIPIEALGAGDDPDPPEPRPEEWQTLACHPFAVNRVVLVNEGDGYAVLSSASDGSWQWNDANGTRQSGLGHVGPVWSVDCMSAGDRRYVVTAGGEGACRLWLAAAVLDEKIARNQPLAHRGPVTAIQLAADPSDHILVITGGGDGDVRAAASGFPEGSVLLARHESEISALLSVSVDEARSHVVSGSVDGTLRLTPIAARNQRESTVLGIAHEGVMALSASVLGEVHDLISGGQDGTITLWDLGTRMPKKTVQGCRYGAVQALCHIESRGEGALVVGGQDGRLSTFYATELKLRGTPTTLESGVLCLCPLPGSASGVLAGLTDGRIAVVPDLSAYRDDIAYIRASENEIRGLRTLILGGRIFVACAGLDRHLRLVDIQSGEDVVDIELDGYALSLSALGSSVGLGSSAGAAVISYPTDILSLNS